MSLPQKPAQPKRRKKKPIRSSLRDQLAGRWEILSKWVCTSPLVDSHVEEENPGTAKKTRTNTLMNRECRITQQAFDKADLFNARFRSSPQGQYHSVPVLPTIRPRKVSFANTVHEFSHGTPNQPKIVQIRQHSAYPLEVRERKQRDGSFGLDPSQPVHTIPTWLQRK